MGNYKDQKSEYNYYPQESNSKEYRDEEKPNIDGVDVPVEEGGTSFGNNKISGGQNRWGALRPDLSLKNLGERSFSSLTTGSIKIPTSNSPMFSVDAEGNVVAESLRRKDFHWYTLFESLDGYGLSGDVDPTIDINGVRFVPDATSGHFSQLQKFATALVGFTWDKKRSFAIAMFVDGTFDGGQQTFYFGTGDMDDPNDRKVGFLIEDNNLYGVMGNGTSQETTLLGDIATIGVSGSNVKFSMYFDPDNGAEFFINDVSYGTLSTYIPSGTNNATRLLDVDLQTDENVAKIAIVGYYDFWQAL